MVECAGLEIRYTVSPYRGFESLLLRQGPVHRVQGRPRKQQRALRNQGPLSFEVQDRPSRSSPYGGTNGEPRQALRGNFSSRLEGPHRCLKSGAHTRPGAPMTSRAASGTPAVRSSGTRSRADFLCATRWFVGALSTPRILSSPQRPGRRVWTSMWTPGAWRAGAGFAALACRLSSSFPRPDVAPVCGMRATAAVGHERSWVAKPRERSLWACFLDWNRSL